jgi:hypothetical protein
MDIAIPHSLGREEVRRRLRANSHSIGDSIPGGMADVTTGWPSEDRMSLNIGAMGQSIEGYVDIEDDAVRFHVELPMALGFLKPMIEGVIQDQGRKLIAPPKG